MGFVALKKNNVICLRLPTLHSARTFEDNVLVAKLLQFLQISTTNAAL